VCEPCHLADLGRSRGSASNERCPSCVAGMLLHRGRGVTAQKASALGMLSTEAGLAAMEAIVLTTRHRAHVPPPSVVGVAPGAYWSTLLQHVHLVPPMYQNLVDPNRLEAHRVGAASHVMARDRGT
jgi:hypothetical protein